MRRLFGTLVVAAATLGLVVASGPALGQETGQENPKAAKPQDTGKKDSKKKDGKKGAEGEAKKEGADAGEGELKSKLADLRGKMADSLQLTEKQKPAIDALFQAFIKASAEAAKAKKDFEAAEGEKQKQLEAQMEAAKQAGDEAKMKALSDQMAEMKKKKVEALKVHPAPSEIELFNNIEKALEPAQADKFRKMLSDLKLVAPENAGASLEPKEFIKAVTGKDVGLDDAQRKAVEAIYKKASGELKKASAKNPEKVKDLTAKLRADVKAAMRPEQWQAALNTLAQAERKAQKENKKEKDEGAAKEGKDKKAKDDEAKKNGGEGDKKKKG